MSWWEIVKLILKYGPTVVAVVSEIWDLIQQISRDEPSVAQFYARKLEVAKAATKELKSKEPLKALKRELLERLHGIPS